MYFQEGGSLSIGEGNGTPLQYFCLENPMDGGPWWAAVHGVARVWHDFTFTFHFHALEKEMATHSSVLAWRIPGMGKPGGLPSMRSHRVGHDWSDLAVEAAAFLWGKPRLWLTELNTQGPHLRIPRTARGWERIHLCPPGGAAKQKSWASHGVKNSLDSFLFRKIEGILLTR